MELIHLKADDDFKDSFDYYYYVKVPKEYENCQLVAFPPIGIGSTTLRLVNHGVVIPDNKGVITLRYAFDKDIGRGNNKFFSKADNVVTLLVLDPKTEDYQSDDYDEE